MKQAIILGVVLLSVLPGCNTMKGVGQDVEGAGESLEHAAKKTHDSIKQAS